MKTRLFILIGLTAIATLSFTFSVSNKQSVPASNATANTAKAHSGEPAGGLLSEDKL